MDNQQIKSVLNFFDTIYNLPAPDPTKIHKKTGDSEKIPVILSSDDGYCKFIATCGVSILYNTNAFIEFYVLCDGISPANKRLIEEAFRGITQNFSIEYIDVHAKDFFPEIKLESRYYVSLSTCNRLLVPQLIPHLDRAIYLDVDLILLDDIAKLWHEDLEGHIFGAVPLVVDRYTTLEKLRERAKIPTDALSSNYKYFNSGVLLIDYHKWRLLKHSNEEIFKELMEIAQKVEIPSTPDEIILNHFAYNNGGYKVLAHKYNCHSVFSYNYLKNKLELSPKEKATLEDFEKSIRFFHFEADVTLSDGICIHHFWGGSEKPWNTTKGGYYPNSRITHFDEFWFYAKLTPYYDDLRINFLNRHTNLKLEAVTAQNYRQIKYVLKMILELPRFRKELRRTKFLLLFCWWGRAHQKLKERKKRIKNDIREAISLIHLA